LKYATLLVLFAGLGCSSPAKVEVRPDPLVLEGEGKRGKLEAFIFDEDGKQLIGDHAVTWMCLDAKTIKVQQDGNQMRTYLKVTPLSPGETYLTATYKNLARDIRVTVKNPL